MISFDEIFSNVRDRVQKEMALHLPFGGGLAQPLFEAMAYSGLSQGKMIRPFFILEIGRFFDVPEKRLLRVAASLEFMHINSLILDDLPCMDDAAMRRAKPACHKVFGEAIAILTACSMHSLAFEMLTSQETHPDAGIRMMLVQKLAVAAGLRGLMSGQAKDLICEKNNKDVTLENLFEISAQKTGVLFEYACESPAILGGAQPHEREKLISFGKNFGLLFQMVDDVLDQEGTEDSLGKDAGKDIHKATYPRLLGMEKTKKHIKELAEEIEDEIAYFKESETLQQLVRYVLSRVAL